MSKVSQEKGCRTVNVARLGAVLVAQLATRRRVVLPDAQQHLHNRAGKFVDERL